MGVRPASRGLTWSSPRTTGRVGVVVGVIGPVLSSSDVSSSCAKGPGVAARVGWRRGLTGFLGYGCARGARGRSVRAGPTEDDADGVGDASASEGAKSLAVVATAEGLGCSTAFESAGLALVVTAAAGVAAGAAAASAAFFEGRFRLSLGCFSGWVTSLPPFLPLEFLVFVLAAPLVTDTARAADVVLLRPVTDLVRAMLSVCGRADQE